MIVYMDGSSVRSTNTQKQKDWLLSWGLVVHHDDITTEHHGHVSEVHQRFNGFHEMLAFAEAVKLVKHMKVPFEEVSFITDDEWVVNAQFVMHPDNWCGERAEQVKNRLMMFVNEFFPSTMYDDMLEALHKARFTKVKGHESTVYNLRVDYLAAHARQLKLGVYDDFLTFEQWLARGFKFFNTKKKLYDVWYAPFASLAA
jgi:ribonuclease HI